MNPTNPNPLSDQLSQSEKGSFLPVYFERMVEDVKKLTETTKEMQENAKRQQGVIDNMITELRHSQGLVFFGFIFLLFMMAAVIVDVSVNILTKSDSPQVIYQIKK